MSDEKVSVMAQMIGRMSPKTEFASEQDVINLCDSVLGNCYLGKEVETELAERVKKTILSKKA